MAKRKWYVVTSGKEIGVFATWLEVAPLVHGLSGAIHQSFDTEEEAWRAFNEQKAKGNTEVLRGATTTTSSNATRGIPSTASLARSYSTPSSPALLALPSRNDGDTPRVASEGPAQAAHDPLVCVPSLPAQESSRRRHSPNSSLSSPATGVTQIVGSTYPATPEAEPHSPQPRASVRATSSAELSPRRGTAQTESNPSTPGSRSQQPRASVRISAMAPSYPISTSDPVLSPEMLWTLSSGALSPLTSPMLNSGLMTAHNSPDIPSPVPLPPSPRERVHERGDLEWPVTTVMPPYTDIYCECSNNCPDCNRPRHPATLALAGISSYGLAPAHVPNTTMRDPRSPFGSRTAVPMAFEQSPTFGRPSPERPVEQILDSLQLY